MKLLKSITLALILTATTFALSANRVVVRTTPARTIVVTKTNLGKVDINSTQDKAKVYVNGKYVGLADQFDGFPGKLQLAAGTYRITLKYKDVTHHERVRVRAGKEVDLNVRL